MQSYNARPAEQPLPLWKNRDYLLLWSGQSISIIGTYVSQIAFPLLVLAITQSPTQAGFVAAARSLPYLLFTLPAGALVDRWDRKRTMIVCSAISAMALASIVVTAALGSLTITQLVLVSFVEGTCAVIFRLAETSAVAHVVPPAQLPTAMAQQQVQYSVGAIVGPPLGGALYAVSSLLPFILDAGSYTVSCLALTAIRTPFQPVRTVARHALQIEISEGVKWLWRHGLIRYMALLTGGINFVTSGGVLLLIVLAAEQGASSTLTGTIFAVVGVAGILGALVAPYVQRRLTFGQAIIGVCWGYMAAWSLFTAATTPLLLMLVGGAVMLISPIYDTVQMSYRLAVIPNALQGRVNSVFRLVADGMKALGVAATGISLEQLGTTRTILVAAGLLLVLAVVTVRNRQVRTAPATA